MPELPEVETIRRQLSHRLHGASIIDAWSFGTDKYSDADAAVGYSITRVARRGKYLIIGLEGAGSEGARRKGVDLDACGSKDAPDAELIIHLGMTGRLSIAEPTDTELAVAEPTGDDVAFVDRSRPAHLRAEWLLNDDRIFQFTDIRRFGRLAVVEPGNYRDLPTLDQLGPEPFDVDFTAEDLRFRINASTQAVKTQLMSQRVVAGLGNIYVDEALWMAQVHPLSKRVTRSEAALLRSAMVDVLNAALANGGTTLRDYRDASGAQGTNQNRLKCYGRSGQACLRCNSTLRKVTVGGRTTTYCPLCQRRRM